MIRDNINLAKSYLNNMLNSNIDINKTQIEFILNVLESYKQLIEKQNKRALDYNSKNSERKRIQRKIDYIRRKPILNENDKDKLNTLLEKRNNLKSPSD